MKRRRNDLRFPGEGREIAPSATRCNGPAGLRCRARPNHGGEVVLDAGVASRTFAGKAERGQLFLIETAPAR